jgi:signal transduction histidine kinase
MRAIGGQFQVQSTAGKGTEITVLAPLLDAVQE